MSSRTIVSRRFDTKSETIQWLESSPLTSRIETREGEIQVRHGRFVGGASDQVEVIEVDTGAVRALILPTRGMSIWKMEAGGTRYGWDSPVAGPVHPSQVPVFDPGGIGWLEGFDELLVRCGLVSNGAPEHNESGQLVYPLHGRIGNLAADSLGIEYDEASGRLEVIGDVIESKLFIQRLRLRSRIRFQAGSSQIDLLDDVTNELSTPTTMQLLYHINVGTPVLGAGATLHAPIESLAPKDSLSASEIERWNQYEAPRSGYSERVYFAKLLADEGNETVAMLTNAGGDSALAVEFNVTGLPRFIVWKNTAAESDGYVTGLEPATNYPNQRSFEESQGRVVEIRPGDTKSFRITLHPLTDSDSVQSMKARIDTLQAEQKPEIHDRPRPGWSPGA